MPAEVAGPPAVIENPVIPPDVQLSDVELSKKSFNDAMAAEKGKPAEPEPPVEPTPVIDATPSKPAVEPIAEPSKEPAVVAEPPAAKGKVPEELISGKKPEPKVDEAIAEIDAMVLPKNAKPEQVASFAKLKDQAKKVILEKQARIVELQSKTTDAASRADIEAANERVKAAESRAKELESTLERIAFTESPKFKRFLDDETATLASAKSYLEGTEINPAIVDVAAHTSGAKRIQMLREAGADAEQIAAIAPYLAEYDRIQRYKGAALENWKAESAQMSEQANAQREAQMAQRRQVEDKVWSQVVAETANDIAAYKKFDANDDWNARADELDAEAKRVFNGEGVELKDVAAYIRKGVAFDAEHEIRMAVTEELNKLIQENSRLKAAKPTAGNGAVPAPKADANLSDEQAHKNAFNTALAQARGG